MDTAVHVAVDIAGVLSLVSLGTFLTACVRLTQDRSDAPRHAETAARAESAKWSIPVGASFLSL